ncbi:MAG: HIRAN domain-containing protein [Fimbriimonadales bacterium]
MSTTAPPRTRFNEIKLVWRPRPHTSRLVVGTLARGQDGYAFRYDGPDLEEAKNAGFRGYPGFEIFNKSFNGQAMSAFAARLPSRERSDYDKLIGAWGATPNMDDFQLLGMTCGSLPTDMFEFIPAILPESGAVFYSDLAGLQNYVASETFRSLPEGTHLGLSPNPANEKDCHAVRVLHEGHQLAHIKRVHCDSICAALDNGLTVQCILARRRINGELKQVVVRVSYK